MINGLTDRGIHNIPITFFKKMWSAALMISIQLILAYSWARPAILVAGKGRRGMFLFLLFLHFHS